MSDIGFGLLDSLRHAQSTKDSLMQMVLMALSSVERVIVFEGDTDYQVYDEWLKNNNSYSNAEHICAKGKSQLVNLYSHSRAINHTDIINGCKFFVDHDYDLESHNDNCITTLNCYSVENYLVNEYALVNILKDEFHLDACRLNERNTIIRQFREDLSTFNKLAKDVCYPLFVKHNIDGKAKFYNRITDLILIDYGSVRLKGSYLDMVPCINDMQCAELEELFNRLPYIRAIRGKYHFEFIKKWLVSLRDLINSSGFLDIPKVNKDPAQMDMRRFASATPPPTELIDSINLRPH